MLCSNFIKKVSNTRIKFNFVSNILNFKVVVSSNWLDYIVEVVLNLMGLSKLKEAKLKFVDFVESCSLLVVDDED